jgi:hypothetical protein
VGQADLVNELNGFVGDEAVGSRQEGWYLQGAFDVLSLWPGSRMGLLPYVRYEQYDTQASVPAGFERNPANDVHELTLGLAFKPIDQLVVKVDWQERRDAAQTGVNQWNWRSGTFPEPLMSMRRGPIALAVTLAVLAARPSRAKVFLNQEEALRLAFPAGTKVERRNAFLTPSQQAAAAKLARATHPPGALVAYYVGIRDGREIGTAYFDTHVVRTETETLMILIDPTGGIARIEVLSFAEPEEYLPREHCTDSSRARSSTTSSRSHAEFVPWPGRR